MKILINHSAVEIDPAMSVAEVLVRENLAGDGVAVAVDNVVVPRAQWATTRLREGANVTVIRAVCGG